MRDSWKETMGKLLLLDADVIIDLHILGLFEKYAILCMFCTYIVVDKFTLEL